MTDAYKKRLSMLHEYIKPNKPKKMQNRKINNNIEIKAQQSVDRISIAQMVKQARENEEDIVDVIRTYITVMEVSIV